MEVKNLTPHPINLVLPGGNRTIAPEPVPVRCTETITPAGALGDIPLISKVLGKLEGLPPAVPGVALVVSLAAAQAAWGIGRADVLAIGESVRDEAGRISGAKSLSANPSGGFSFMDACGNRVQEDGGSEADGD